MAPCLRRALARGEAAGLQALHEGALLHEALHLGAAYGYELFCLELLERPEVPANEQDSSGCTALHYAASRGHLAVCQLLLGHWRFKAQELQDWHGWTALHAAAHHGRAEACEAILGCARFRAAAARDRDGQTALHLAARRGHEAICRSLARHEAFRSTACVAPGA